MALLPSTESRAEWAQASEAIDGALRRVACQAREAGSPESFFSFLFESLLPVVKGDYAAVWLVGDQQPERHVSSAGASQAAGPLPAEIEQVVECKQSSVHVRPQQGERPPGMVFLCPLTFDDEAAGVLEVHRAAAVSGEIQASYVNLLSEFAERATDFHCRHRARTLLRQRQSQERLDSFIVSIHHSLSLAQTCYTIANEGRRLVGCDRLCVLVNQRGPFKTQAISGLDTFDSRSEELVQLERLVGALAPTGEPLWFEGDASDEVPVIERLVQSYVDQSCAQTVVVIPLRGLVSPGPSPPACTGALVFERFEGGPFQPPEREMLAAVVRHAQPALHNGMTLNRLPLLWLSRLLQKCGGVFGSRQVPRALLGIAAALALVIASAVVKTDFAIPCRGELKPVQRREVFAPFDGSIELLVGYGDRVRQGEALLVLHNPDLDYEYTRVLGEIQTTETRLRAVRASSASTSRDEGPRDAYALGADEERLKELLRGLRQQQAVLQQQREALRVASPIDGRVLTWKAAELLQARPVKQGQRLLSIVDPDGPWELESDVADRDIGHVFAARRETPALDTEFFLATDPAVVHHGVVRTVALASEANERSGSSVHVTIAVDHGNRWQPRPGAGVVAKIHCGRRSLAYVWLRDVVDVIRTRLLF